MTTILTGLTCLADHLHNVAPIGIVKDDRQLTRALILLPIAVAVTDRFERTHVSLQRSNVSLLAVYLGASTYSIDMGRSKGTWYTCGKIINARRLQGRECGSRMFH